MNYLDNIKTAVPLILILLIFFFGITGLKLSGMGGALETDHPTLYAKILRFLARGYYISLALSIPITILEGKGRIGLDVMIYLALALWIGLIGIFASREKKWIHNYILANSKWFSFFYVIVPLYLFTGVTVFELLASSLR